MPHSDPAVRAAYHKAYRATYIQDPENRAKVRKADRARAERIRRHIDSVKMTSGCADCGYAGHPAALDFDHLGDKALNVSSAKSVAQADIEIAKCEVRCANCHRIKSWERAWCKPDIFAATYEAVE
jgi:hypothetical protein